MATKTFTPSGLFSSVMDESHPLTLVCLHIKIKGPNLSLPAAYKYGQNDNIPPFTRCTGCFHPITLAQPDVHAWPPRLKKEKLQCAKTSPSWFISHKTIWKLIMSRHWILCIYTLLKYYTYMLTVYQCCRWGRCTKGLKLGRVLFLPTTCKCSTRQSIIHVAHNISSGSTVLEAADVPHQQFFTNLEYPWLRDPRTAAWP